MAIKHALDWYALFDYGKIMDISYNFSYKIIGNFCCNFFVLCICGGCAEKWSLFRMMQLR